MKHFERFDDQKLDSLRARYRGDDLFRTWAWLLGRLERQRDGLNAVEVWSETERLRRQLADIKEHRDTEAEFLYQQLVSRHQSERTAITILAVLFSQMADAAPDEGDDAAERNPNQAVCSVLARELTAPEHGDFATELIEEFGRRRYDNEGHKIVLPVTNYMEVKSPLQLMDDEAKASVETRVGEILELTQGIKRMLAVPWEVYAAIWRDICAIQEVGEIIGDCQPRRNRWGKNLKLVANVLGMMRDMKCGKRALVDGTVLAVSNALGHNVRSYVSYHADFGSSNTPLTQKLHARIKQLIEEAVAEETDKG